MRVVVGGAIGAGKSTVLGILKAFYGVHEEPVHEFTLLEDFCDCPDRYAFALQVQIMLALAKLEDAIPAHGVQLQERDLDDALRVFSVAGHAAGTITDIEFNVLHELWRRIRPPTQKMRVLLKVDADVACARVRARARAQESGLDEEWVRRVVARYDEMEGEYDLVIETTGKTPSQVAFELRHAIEDAVEQCND